MAQGPNIYGELIRAQFENLASDPTPGVTGRVIWHTGDTRAKVDTGAAIKALAWLSETPPMTTVVETQDSYVAYPASTPAAWYTLDTITLPTAGTWLVTFSVSGGIPDAIPTDLDLGAEISIALSSTSSTATTPTLSLLYVIQQINNDTGDKNFPFYNVTSEPIVLTPSGSTTYYLKLKTENWGPADTDIIKNKWRIFAVRIA